MSNRIIGNPGRYIQGPGELKKVCQYAGIYGRRMVIIAGQRAKKAIEDCVNESAKSSGMIIDWVDFGGECSDREIQRVTEIARAKGCDLIAGAGGGKALDTAKAVAAKLSIEVVCVPTIAATDAPCLGLSAIYTEEGTVQEYRVHDKNPALVIADSAVISKAPARFFASGMGDGLSTYFEVRACVNSNTPNQYGSRQSRTSRQLAKLSYDIILQQGFSAYMAVKNGACTAAVEDLIEADVYLSGIAAEGGGDGGAHAVHNGLETLPETKAYYHGEKVTFGIFVQLILENESEELLEKLYKFCISVDLPVTLAQLGVTEATKEKLMKVAEVAAADTLVNMPFDVTVEDTYSAIVTADRLGQYYLDQYQGARHKKEAAQ